MSNNYLTEEDFDFQPSNSALEDKADEITNYTSSVLLDLADEDVAVIEDVQSIFNLLKTSLFANSDTILKSKQLGFTEDERKKLDDVQLVLLTKWKEFGFTEGFFHQYYQVERHLSNAELSNIQMERIKLLLQILNEQKTLVIAFNVMGSKEPPVLLDVEDYM
jgi:hypothetical protein